MSQRIPFADMAYEIDRLVWSKQTWLADFSHGPKKRPDHEIQHHRRQLMILKQASADYRAAAERESARSNAALNEPGAQQ